MQGKLTVAFHGEEGIDAGGVSREWYQVRLPLSTLSLHCISALTWLQLASAGRLFQQVNGLNCECNFLAAYRLSTYF